MANAMAKLSQRHEAQTAYKIIAELTFAFWSLLFNTQLQDEMWKDLRLVFARSPNRCVSDILCLPH